MTSPDGSVVRVQCDDEIHPTACLVAPNQTADGGELRHVKDCGPATAKATYQALVSGGVPLTPAVAEAPPGYERSARGRAYQIRFDLLDRVYLGVGWAPVYDRSPGVGPGYSLGRAVTEVGADVSVLSPQGRSRHDLQIAKGSISLGDLNVNGLLFAYDYQQVHVRPSFYVTTFFGAPRLYPAAIPLGWGFRVLDVQDRPPSAPSTLDMEISEVHLSWNPVQSSDMYSRLRIEAGADFGKSWADRSQLAQDVTSGRWYGGFTSALRSRLSLGQGGLHYLFADVTYLRPTLVADATLPSRALNRFTAQLAYEGVLVAVNDQPISLRVAANGAVRQDLVTSGYDVEVGATVGLRFSFWAPPRVVEPLPELEDP
jgi:hypothetical protein